MEALRARYEAIGPDASAEEIRLAAENLARRQFMPTLILAVPNFVTLTRKDMLAELDRVAALPADSEELLAVRGIADTEEVKRRHLELLLHQYELLSGLRIGDGDAWIVINELYEDD